MKTAWLILLISAATDAAITFITGLTVGNAATGRSFPDGPTFFYSALGGLLVALRTIQQALKATPSQAAELRGSDVTTVTKTAGQTVITAPRGQMDAQQVARSSQNVLPKEGP